MPAVGGPLESVSLDGRNFAVSADTDAARKLGGFENESAANGDGTSRLIKTRVNWQLNDVQIEMDDSRGDHEFLQDLMNRPDFFPITATYASGDVYQGTGQILGEPTASTANAVMSVNMGGPQEFTKQ